MFCYLKGRVQGYGSYDELTTSGINPRELFNDTEDSELPHITNTDIVEECSDVVEEIDKLNINSSDNVQLLPAQKNRKFVESKQLENDPGLAANQMLDEVSIYTTPSMFSLISMPNKHDSNIRIHEVII